MEVTVSCQPLNAKIRFLFQVNPCGISGGQSVSGTRFSPSASVFSYQHHCTNAPHSSPSTCCSYQQGKGNKPGYIKSAALSRKSGRTGQNTVFTPTLMFMANVNLPTADNRDILAVNLFGTTSMKIFWPIFTH